MFIMAYFQHEQIVLIATWLWSVPCFGASGLDVQQPEREEFAGEFLRDGSVQQ